jgi:hypothetical protein
MATALSMEYQIRDVDFHDHPELSGWIDQNRGEEPDEAVVPAKGEDAELLQFAISRAPATESFNS